MRHDCFPDSPVDWPKGVFSELAVVNPRYVLDGRRNYPFLEMASVGENFGGVLGFEQRPADSSGLVRFRKNDILFGKITPCAENGKVALVSALPDEFGLGSTEFVVLSPKAGHVPRFVYALACSGPVHGRAVSRMEGSTGRLRITEDVFTKWLVVPLPPPNEQAAIARILDAADTAIERARLAVEKAAVLGRNLRETLVVDADWPLERLGGFIADGPTNGVYRPESDYGVEGTPIIRIDSFGVGTIRNIAGLRRVRLPSVLRDRYTTGEGDILINRVNSLDFIGKAALVPPMPETTIFESNMMRMRLRDTLRADYLIEVLLSSVAKRHWLMRAKAAVNQASINQRDVASLRIPLPSPEKQKEIAVIMAQQRRVFESVNARLAALERLKRGLMQDLLTGRVRVKTAAAALAATV